MAQMLISKIPQAIRWADVKVPAKVRENAKKGLKLREEYGRGGTQVGLNTAKLLSEKKTLPWAFVRKIAQYFPRHKGDNLNNETSNGYIAWMLWGGDEGWGWAEAVVEEGERLAQEERANVRGRGK